VRQVEVASFLEDDEKTQEFLQSTQQEAERAESQARVPKARRRPQSA
jgi:hypothetical protein